MGEEPHRQTVRVELYGEFVEPWAYVALRRLLHVREDMAAERDVELHWRAIGLPPAEDARDDAVVAAAVEGIEMRPDWLLRRPDTLDAHRLSWLAAQHHRLPAVLEGVFAAHFIDGRDLADTDVLGDVAAAAEMDADAVSALLRSTTGTADIRAQERHARHLGFEHIPTLLLAEHLPVAGVPPVDDLARLVRHALDTA
jgi:predicted DsbA family dithiol-disulfide isomerase